MVSLTDIVLQKRTVHIAAGDIELSALSIRKVADLFRLFPMLRQVMTPGAPTIDIETLIISFPDAVGAVIAESAGQADAADSIADNLSLEDLAECLGVVLELTAPRGIGPLLDRVGKVFGLSLTSQRDGQPGRDPATSLPKRLNNSSPADIHAET
jgi:hypothetical protein